MKKSLLTLLSLLVLVAYIIVTDPFTNESILDNLPYGIAAVFLLKSFLLSISFILLMSYIVDLITDRSYGVDEKELVRTAKETSNGAGFILIARSIIFLAGAIIILGVLLYSRNI